MTKTHMTKTKTLAGAAAILFAISGAALAQSQGAGSSNSGPNAGTTQPGAADSTMNRDKMGGDKMGNDKMGTKSGTSSATTGQSGQSNPESNRVKTQNTDPQK